MRRGGGRSSILRRGGSACSGVGVRCVGDEGVIIVLAMYDIARRAGDEAMGARPVGDEGVGARRVSDEGLIEIARRSGDEEVLIVLLAMGARPVVDEEVVVLATKEIAFRVGDATMGAHACDDC